VLEWWLVVGWLLGLAVVVVVVDLRHGYVGGVARLGLTGDGESGW
jgi:hypothetical protein